MGGAKWGVSLDRGLGTNYGNQCSGDRALFPNSSQLENAGSGKGCRECSQM